MFHISFCSARCRVARVTAAVPRFPSFHQFYWLNVNAGYDGDVYLTIVLNGFIHTVMYTYYFVSMHTKDIWWKKYLTLMQVRVVPL